MFRRGRLDEEVASHLAEETADNIARGMDPGAARQAAMRAFGNVEAAKETVRERNPWYWLDTLWRDVGFAFRLIVRNPWLSAIIIATLTTGITINVSAFNSPVDIQRTRPPYMFVRVSGDTRAPASAIREIVRGIDPQMAVTVATLSSTVERQGEQMKPVTVYGAAAGILALLLALTGVYAVVSFSVSQRVREIGIRTALGAQRRDVITLILRSGAAPVIGGLVAGIGLALSVSAVMESVLLGVNPRDPFTLIVVSSLLLVAALGAIWIPARRAAALDPLASLRHE